MGITEQLVDIYFKEEWWSEHKMPYEDAYAYHSRRVQNGTIYAFVEEGEVLGYFERYFIHNVCFLHNVWVRKDERHGRVFRSLYKHFFSTMPREITTIAGEKQKLGGITRERKIYGKH
jgi:hypothetical protein